LPPAVGRLAPNKTRGRVMGSAIAKKPKPADLPKTMPKEFELAKAEGRQPRCIHCGDPLDTVVEVQTVTIIWTWNAKEKRYLKDDSGGDSYQPECDNCGTKDNDFTGNDFIDY